LKYLRKCLVIGLSEFREPCRRATRPTRPSEPGAGLLTMRVLKDVGGFLSEISLRRFRFHVPYMRLT
jgi:hypothetical protein